MHDATGAETRPASVWPANTRPADSAFSEFAPTHFDPLLDERAREREHATVALEVCSVPLVLRVLLFVQAVLAAGVLAASATAAGWPAQQAAAIFVGLVATLLWLAAVCALRRIVARLPGATRLVALAALGAGAALLAWWPLTWAGMADTAGGLRAPGVALGGALLAGTVWFWLDLRARLWHPVDASVRLAELQARIRPHFLFNALNTALALVRIDPVRAEGVLEDLSQLFRVVLADAGTSVSLDEEIQLAQRYLAIEQTRFGQRLKLHWDIDARVGRARVPPLVLQPLVENAVRHGVEPAVGGGHVWVRATLRRGQAEVVVTNTVPDAASTPGQGMALRNVRERLRLLHDFAGQCEVWREAGLFRARIVVPM
jgi:two-component system sensor histidine kinase AlgZ